ncbi:Uncharacterized protein Rs2_42806 [Raphanus sativus]|nr:Uncharacterized protein Rs2_42806 [Raphanus sativus]
MGPGEGKDCWELEGLDLFRGGLGSGELEWEGDLAKRTSWFWGFEGDKRGREVDEGKGEEEGGEGRFMEDEDKGKEERGDGFGRRMTRREPEPEKEQRGQKAVSQALARQEGRVQQTF